MRDWGFWDWLGFVTLFLAAIFMAIDAALKNSPNVKARLPDVTAIRIWPFLPLILLCVATTVFLGRELGILGQHQVRTVAESGTKVVSAIDQKATVPTPAAITSTPAVPFPAPALELPRPSPPPNNKDEERIFLGPTTTPQFIASQIRGMTGVQAAAYGEQYKGKWITLTGSIVSVTKSSSEVYVALREHLSASMFFDNSWLEKLSVLRLGERVTVACRIATVQYRMTLDRCEIVRVGR